MARYGASFFGVYESHRRRIFLKMRLIHREKKRDMSAPNTHFSAPKGTYLAAPEAAAK